MAAFDSESTPDVSPGDHSPVAPLPPVPLPPVPAGAAQESTPARKSGEPKRPAVPQPPKLDKAVAAPNRWSQAVATGPGAGAADDSSKSKKKSSKEPPKVVGKAGDAEHPDLTKVATRNAPPWLVSSLVHMVLIILLGLWLMPVDLPKMISLQLLGPEHDQIGEQLVDDSALGGDEQTTETPIITPDDLPAVDDPFAAPPKLDLVPEGTSGVSTVEAPAIGLALAGREEGSKKILLGKYGGTGATEGAVAAGLAWLVKQQRADGSWSLRGPYSDGSQFENTAAATAMALLAFQGAGNTHEKGKYKGAVEKGANYLLKLEDEQGNFFHSGPLHSGLYSQAQCTIAICELYAMSQDSRLRDAAERAVRYCCDAQDKRLGGWRYMPAEDSDTSVTGWFVMALQSAKMAKLEVPSITIDNINRFLDSVALEEGSRYSYIIGAESKRSMTAEGLLCRQWLGWTQSDERISRGADYLVAQENLPDWANRDVYYWYYATQMLHHLEGPRWDTWNGVIRELLPSRQESRGPEAGSWHPTGARADQWGFHGGRLYVTCLSIYILEVYYRHLPIYRGGAVLGR